MLFLGIFAFLLFLLSDMNDYKWNRPYLRGAFFAGVFILVLSTLISYKNHIRIPSMILTVVFAVIHLAAMILLIISLFFSFSNAEGYMSSGKKRKVFSKKLYAFSRHPGVLFFIIVYATLSVFGYPIEDTVILSVLNILLALFEDKIVFPRILDGYEEYKKQTPFMVPSKESLMKCIDDYKKEYYEVSGKA